MKGEKKMTTMYNHDRAYSKPRYFKKVEDMPLVLFNWRMSDERTRHCNKRKKRFSLINPNAEAVDGFIAVVDRKHKNGKEIHAYFQDGSLRIYNYDSRKLVTIMFPRVEQVERIMDNRKYKELPKNIKEKCIMNEMTHKNEIKA